MTNDLLARLYLDAAKLQVESSYKRFQNSYKSIAMDLTDVEQEIKLWIFEQVTPELETKKWSELCEYVGKIVRNKLLRILQQSYTVDYTQGIVAFTDNPALTDEQILEELAKEGLTGLPYRILYKRFIEGKSQYEIATEEGTTRGKINNTFVATFNQFAKSKNRVVNMERISSLGAHEELNEQDSLEDCVDMGSMDLASIAKMDDSNVLFLMIQPHLSQLEFTIIEKMFKEQLNIREVADAVSCSKSTVCYQYQKAIQKIRNIMNKY